MVHPRAMGIGAMFILLVIAIVILPILVRYLTRMETHYSISGFQNAQAQQAQQAQQSQQAQHTQQVPTISSAMSQTYVPDANTDYMCRAPHGGSEPCPEGTFCDGLTQACIPNYIGGSVPDTGYYA